MASVRTKRIATWGIVGGAVAAAGLALALSPRGGAAVKRRVAAPPATAKLSSAQALTRVDSATCDVAGAPAKSVEVGDPRARAAAQRGLDFLVRDTLAWQDRHNCYGCHVQAVTLDGLVIGRKHQYDVSDDHLEAVVRGLTELRGGVHTAGGLQYQTGSLLQPSKAFGGAALARYDLMIAGTLSGDVVATAEQLLAYQAEDGGYRMEYQNGQVAVGDVQGTYLAIRTWKQAYERTADDRWLTAVQKAERWLHGQAKAMLSSNADGVAIDSQQLSYALLGLLEAGVGASEELPSALRRRLVDQQDGTTGAWHGSALATGQALHALRMAGMTETEPAIARGTVWLIENQHEDGGWSTGGVARAEAMWAVLGMVSLDVLTISLSDVRDGQRAAAEQKVRARAVDNKGGAVVKMELAIDDILVASSCGSELEFVWNTRTIEDGKHIAVVSAHNSRGEVSKRRLELYTGDVYLTQAGALHTTEGNVVTVRNIAGEGDDNRVRMRVLDERGREVDVSEQTGAQGPMRFVWDGSKAESGKYTARLEVMDSGGRVAQVVDVPVLNASREEQQQRWGEVEGKLAFGSGAAAENSMLELVDEDGNVVAQTRSTKNGNYRFRGVDKGNYKVRLKKSGYKQVEMPVSAAPAAAVSADLVAEEE